MATKGANAFSRFKIELSKIPALLLILIIAILDIPSFFDKLSLESVAERGTADIYVLPSVHSMTLVLFVGFHLLDNFGDKCYNNNAESHSSGVSDVGCGGIYFSIFSSRTSLPLGRTRSTCNGLCANCATVT